MKLVFLIGDAAVGKMTVGQALMRTTGLRLFHNHMTIEPVIEIFGSYNGAAIRRIREVVFEEFARTDSRGMIFTYMWAFDQRSDWDYIEHVKSIFLAANPATEFYYVELIAPLEVRLTRNGTANRLANKPSKRDLESSDRRLLQDDERYRCVSREGEVPFENYLRLENSDIAPEQAAEIIRLRFAL